MSEERFPDRRAVMFGRAPDVATLLGRCSDTDAPPNGVTFVTGRPKAGKSWLLRELGRRLVEMDYLVGFAESSGATIDLALWAIADAYEQWLTSSTWREQGKSLIERHKKNLVGKVGLAVAEVLELALKGQGNSLGGQVRELFAGLAAADWDLKTGGLALSPLPYDVTRDLADLLHRLSGMPIILIFDAWEQSPRLDHEVGLLDAYLRNADEWPPTHLFVAVRVEDQESEAVRKARALSRSGPYAAQVRLGEMRIKEDPTERQRFLGYLRNVVTTAGEELSDDTLLDEVAGYPGVVEYWTAAARRHDLPDAASLALLAEDAHQLRYRDLEAALARLQHSDGLTFDLALQLTLLPEISGEVDWSTFRRILEPRENLESRIAYLQSQGVLDPNVLDHPTFGHSTRHEAARRWALYPDRRVLTRQAACQLLPRLAGMLRSTNWAEVPYALALAKFTEAEDLLSLQLPDSVRALSYLARSLLSAEKVDELATLHVTATTVSRRHPEANALLAMGLVNARNHAKLDNKLGLRDQLLDQMRRLSANSTDDPAVRENYAMGLYNTLIDRAQEDGLAGCSHLLDELRHFAETHPSDEAVRGQLAASLFSVLNYAKKDGDLTRRDDCLEELRQLAGRLSHDRTVRRQLAKGLFNTLLDSKEEGALARRDHLLVELRRLSEQHSDDSTVRQILVLGIINALSQAKQENERDRCLQFLKELRQLQSEYGVLRRVISRRSVEVGSKRLVEELESLGFSTTESWSLTAPVR